MKNIVRLIIGVVGMGSGAVWLTVDKNDLALVITTACGFLAVHAIAQMRQGILEEKEITAQGE